jgi:hypothetical protein
LNPQEADWLEKPWVYSKPKGEEAAAKWRENWVTYVLEFSEKKNIYSINLLDLRREKPFCKLDQSSFDDIVNCLFSAKHAKWGSRRGKILVICWRSLDKWTDLTIQLTKEKKLALINGLVGLSGLNPQTLCLPKEEQENILKLIVKKKSGYWVDRKKLVVRVV